MKPRNPKSSRPRRAARAVIAETRINPKKATLDLVQRALDAVGHAPQREVIQHLSVTELCKGTGEDFTSLSSLSLGDLRSLGGDELLRLLGRGPRGLKRARVLANHLLSLPMITNAPPHDREPQVVRFPLDPTFEPAAQTGAVPLINPKAGGPVGTSNTYRSTEAELKFMRLLGSLRALGLPPHALARTLHEYWDPTWPEAPFEQALTLGQLLGTDIEAVLRKRSFTARKLSMLSDALEKVLRSSTSARASAPPFSERGPSENQSLHSESTSHVSPPSCDPADPAREHSSWASSSLWKQTPQNSLGDDSSDAALWAIEECLNRFPLRHPLRAALLPLESVADLPMLRSLVVLTQDNGIASPHLLTVQQTLQARIKSHASAFASLLTSALSGPAVSLSRLLVLARELGPLPSSDVWENSTPPLRLLFKILLRAHGASPAQYAGSPLPDVWTMNQELLEMVLTSLFKDRKFSISDSFGDSSFEQVVTKALPLCEPLSFEVLFNCNKE